MTRKHPKTLELIFAYPPSAKVKWRDIEALFRGFGCGVTETEDRGVGVRLLGNEGCFIVPTRRPMPTKEQ